MRNSRCSGPSYCTVNHLTPPDIQYQTDLNNRFLVYLKPGNTLRKRFIEECYHSSRKGHPNTANIRVFSWVAKMSSRPLPPSEQRLFGHIYHYLFIGTFVELEGDYKSRCLRLERKFCLILSSIFQRELLKFL